MQRVNLYFLRYNNYINRYIKKLDTVNDYLQYMIGEPLLECINWNPNDGVTTTQILQNWNHETPDYVIVTDEYSNTVISRWFVIDANYQRNGQYDLHLRRDVIADNLESVLNAKGLIKRGWLDTTSPLLMQKEPGISTNEIKKLQIPLDYKSSPNLPINSSGFVIYTALGFSMDETIDLTLNEIERAGFVTTESLSINTVDFNQIKEIGEIIIYEDIPNGKKYKFNNLGAENNFYKNVAFSEEIDGYFNIIDAIDRSATQKIIMNTPLICLNIDGIYSNTLAINNPRPTQLFEQFYREETNKTLNVAHQAQSDILRYYEEELQIVGQQIKDLEINPTGYLLQLCQSYLRSIKDNIKVILKNVVIYNKRITFRGYANVSSNIKFSALQSSTSPYAMLLIPENGTFLSGQSRYPARTDLLKILNAIIEFGAQNIYDVQYLPFTFNNDTQISAGLATSVVQLISIEEHTTRGIIQLYNNFSNDLGHYDYTLSKYKDLQVKLGYETIKARLTSPNHVGNFEYNPYKNGWNQNYLEFYIDVTLIPINPLIKITPRFTQIYGANFDDARGLILGGDYGYNIITNEWQTYKYNNKNYLEIFNREIENLEYIADKQHTLDITQAAAGATSAAASAAASASTPISALIGGAVAGAASAVAGAADVQINQDLRQENLELKSDLFALNTSSIKARPNQLTRGTTLASYNVLYPYLEIYGATEEELDHLVEYFKNYSFTVNIFGTIKDYLNKRITEYEYTYIKADINYIDINDDYHIAREIREVLSGGVKIENKEYNL